MNPNECIEQKGIVEDIKANRIRIRFQPLSVCDNCQTKSICNLKGNQGNSVEIIDKLFGYNVHEANRNMLEVEVEGKPTDFVVKFTKKYEGKISHLDIARPTLNDVFMNITGRDIRE